MQEEKQPYSNPTPFLLYIFTAQTLVFWGIYQGLFTGDTTLLYGLISLACFPVYVIGGLMLCRNGDGYSGSLYILFGTLFGGMYGLGNLAYFLGGLFGWNLDYTILGVPMLLSFLVVIPTMVPYRFAPWTEFVAWSVVMLWLLCCSLEYFIGGTLLFTLNKWLSLASGVLLAYQCAHTFLLACGAKGLPVGKPLFRYPEA